MGTKPTQLIYQLGWQLGGLALLSSIETLPLKAQPANVAPDDTTLDLPPPQDVQPIPFPETIPISPPSILPSPAELLPSPSIPVPTNPNTFIDTITVEQFNVQGSTVFSPEDFNQILAPYKGKPVSFLDLLGARSAITQHYLEQGYITSGAYIPPQRLGSGVVTIQVVEGTLEDIRVKGTKKLSPRYISSRIQKATSSPLNREKLLEGLQLLLLDPLIENISAELSLGSNPGASILIIDVEEADSFSTPIVIDNRRSPSVSSFRQQLRINEANLLGQGDDLFLTYSSTEGSDAFDGSYSFPLNPNYGTLTLSGGFSDNEVTESPFNILDIESSSNYYQLSLRQPVIRTPTQELAFGFTASRRNSEVIFAPGGEQLGFPSPGANEDGEIRVTALRFFQEYISRNNREVFALRSQFNLGIGAFDATINPDPEPDSRFFSWQGQAQWVRLLGDDSRLLLRGSMQLASTSLVSLEQFGIGGIDSVRGYRQDRLLADNGAFASVEVQIPLFHVAQNSVVQIAPFADVGVVWNVEQEIPESNTLASIGLGLRWSIGDRFSTRFDWGIPLIAVRKSRETTWQENGLYFSLQYNPF